MRDLPVSRNRHRRAVGFVLVSFVSSVFAHAWLGFDSSQTLGYAVVSYLVLTALNFREMFEKELPLLVDDADGPGGQEC